MREPYGHRHLLDENIDTVRTELAQAECDDPVALLIDAALPNRRRLAIRLMAGREGISVAESEAVFDRLSREYRRQGQSPVLIGVIDYKDAVEILSLFTSTATATATRYLNQTRRSRRPGEYLIITVGEDTGFAFTEVSRPIPDGQHRTKIRTQ